MEQDKGLQKQQGKYKGLKKALLYSAFIVIAAAALAILFWPRATADDTMQESSLNSPELSVEPSEEETNPHVNIPDPDELQAIPDYASMNLQPGVMTATLDNGTAYIRWEIDPKAYYYVLCVLDEQDNVLQMDILWPEIDTWEIGFYQGSRLLLLRYDDMDTRDAQDDVLLGAYICETPGAIPTPISTPTLTSSLMPSSAQSQPSSAASRTPKPTAAPNKYYIIVDKADHAFSVFTYDSNGEYTVKVATYPTALGRSSRQTPTGKFKIGNKGDWKQWSNGTYSPYYTSYTSGLYFHGPIYSAKRGDALIPESYNAIGTDASSGCMRTTVAGARFVFYNCPKGTVVEVVASSDKVSWPGKPAIDPDYPTWDPTDPDKPSGPPPTATPSETATTTTTTTTTATGTTTSTVTSSETATDTSSSTSSESASQSAEATPTG